MINIRDAVEAVRRQAPERLQESWDNSGIQILADADAGINKILTCLEIESSVVDEAVECGAKLIVTHHPLFFNKIGNIRDDDPEGAQVIKLIQNGISVYSAHTSFDSAAHGTNQDLAEKLGLIDIVPMYPDETDPDAGMGRYGHYSEPVPFDVFERRLSDVCGADGIRIAGIKPESVQFIGLCTGAGSEFADDAVANGADVFVTGDLKYHEARHICDIGFCVIDAGHYGTEVLFADNMAALLREDIGDRAEIIPSRADINPFV
ncbi:MAG: Nif3-like dinuclear metal center hexameric protein [Anaerovoracaceae bacterium]